MPTDDQNHAELRDQDPRPGVMQQDREPTPEELAAYHQAIREKIERFKAQLQVPVNQPLRIHIIPDDEIQPNVWHSTVGDISRAIVGILEKYNITVTLEEFEEVEEVEATDQELARQGFDKAE